MKGLYILKVGTTFPRTAARLGDFDAWTAGALGPVAGEVRILDIENGAPLPALEECAGVVITGSHSMVTDDLPWSIRLENWIPSLLNARIPLFGICYGHQLLARAAGGEVGFHPSGTEIGTVAIQCLPACSEDVLFQSLPESFPAHVTHAQTVLRLPPGAIPLAFNAHEPHHAFRMAECAWGVQFHPEYDARIMRSYIEEQADGLASAGRDVHEILGRVSETPLASEILKKFAQMVE